ncbi:MAG: PIN domain-containing protein [Bacteroidetes bacterium]|nr:PIN domain-containing protein [Bacteroidota bacterium]
MMNKINITNYTPKNTDKFLFDNNIWMYLYCPIGSYNKYVVDKYSNFFGKILDAKATIYVSSLILSEFYNTYIRLDFNIWKGNKKKDFKKDYRPLPQCKTTSETITNSIESRILGVSKKINDDFVDISINKLIEKIGLLDFNDSYYVELAKKNNFKIVTNDKDFQNIKDDITILSLK